MIRWVLESLFPTPAQADASRRQQAASLKERMENSLGEMEGFKQQFAVMAAEAKARGDDEGHRIAKAQLLETWRDQDRTRKELFAFKMDELKAEQVASQNDLVDAKIAMAQRRIKLPSPAKLKRMAKWMEKVEGRERETNRQLDAVRTATGNRSAETFSENLEYAGISEADCDALIDQMVENPPLPETPRAEKEHPGQTK